MSHSNVDRLAAALADRYRIERELGAGGMATVYLAEDLKHKRKVAVKVLKPELAAVLGAERFVVEITTTAALQHPHILPLFDSGEADGFLYYVMPFIEGETLRAKLDRETQLGVEEAVRITSDVASALHYAHTHGVIHRDIKPENILLHDGRPMVADFGIALAVSAAAGGRMTETGLSLGTPHYMSPEQATAEKEITARSDVYSLGSVLYEMLTGNPPHTGASAQQIIMKIITTPAEPVTVHRKSVPPHVASAVAKTLEKLPADRFDSAAAFSAALANTAFRHAETTAGAPLASGSRTPLGRPHVLLAAAVVAVATLGYVLLNRPAVQPLPTILAELNLRGRDIVAARLSPDGSSILMSPYATNAAVIRRIDDTTFTPVNADGIGGFLADVAFSPNGREIAWLSSDRLLRAPLGGGPSTEIVRIDSLIENDVGGGRGGLTWGTADVIVLSLGGALWRVPASGGALERVPVAAGADALFNPRFLPDGKRVLATRLPNERVPTRDREGDLVIVSPDGDVASVGASGAYGMVIDAGYLVAIVGTDIRSYRFDTRRGRVIGEARLLAGDADIAFVGSRVVDVSQNGIVAWLNEPPPRSEIVITDRRGSGYALPLERGGNRTPRFSPDGRRLAFERGDNGLTSDVWLWDFASARQTRLTADSAYGTPSWAANGEFVFFGGGSKLQSTQSLRDGLRYQMAWRIRVGGGKQQEVFGTASGGVSSPALTPDGRDLIFTSGGRPRDIFRVRLDSAPVVTPLASGPSSEEQFAISPDGKWLAFTSDRVRASNVYLRRLDRDEETWLQVSPDGGQYPRWTRGGELLFIRGDSVMSVSVSAGDPPSVTAPRALFARPPGPVLHWDVTSDGQRFAFSRPLYDNRPLRLRLLLHAFDDRAASNGDRD